MKKTKSVLRAKSLFQIRVDEIVANDSFILVPAPPLDPLLHTLGVLIL